MFLVGALALTFATGASAQEPALRSATFSGLEPRAIGPAVMSGRITSIDGVPGEPITLYIGSASGGVWKSTDGGITYEPVFDDHTQSIGAIAVDPSSPDTVWVGTGETWARNSVSAGDGVYRTEDGGQSWSHLGLPESERIARILVNPEDGSEVFVCATGPLWSAGGERGVYRTRDGGESWERVLEIDEDTGCAELAMDPQDPGILYAGMWDFRRQPWTFRSGGPGSGLYRTRDGGESWEELTEGLPSGTKGRIAVAAAPSRPNRVYALVEADTTALYRSDDLGESWEKVNTSTTVQMRPFYFALVVVDPEDHDRVYKPGFALGVSEDGGESFTSPFTNAFGGGVHSDHHALWIDPNNPHFLALGTDGGVYISHDRGAHWRHVRSLPLSQFYEISVDMDRPYNVYGGLQDNGTWTGPSQSPGGIDNGDWRNIGGGDGFHAYVDPVDPDYVYVEYQGGNIMRFHRPTGETKRIRPYADEDVEELRFNWNTPLHIGQSGTLYAGAQYLFRSTDRGESWDRISPDLSTDDPEKQKQEESGGVTIDNTSAENHTTIYTIAESPLDPSVLWVGTDDGNVQVTRDGGQSWTNVVENVEGVPAHTWVAHVEASAHDPATAFVAFDGHRTGDMATYLYRTEDYGQSWTALADSTMEGWAHVIVQDPEQPALLFAGTEWGLWVSVDGGDGWARYETGLPARVPVRDLAIHPRDHDLVVGTHGRGVWILDDITPLRHLTPAVLAADVAILSSRDAVLDIPTSVQDFPGDGEFQGPNPEAAATLAYYQKSRHLFGDLVVEIYDDDGELVSTVPGSKAPGVNRVQLPTRMPPPKMPPANSLVPVFASGPRLPVGEYMVRLRKGEQLRETTVQLVPDPRSPHSAEDRRIQEEASLRLYRMLEDLTYFVEATADLQEQVKERLEETRGRTHRRLERYGDALESFRTGLVATSQGGIFGGDEKLRERLATLYGAVVGYTGRPTRSQLDQIDTLDAELEAAREDFEALTSTRRLERVDDALVLMSREEVETRDAG
jgi:photosystem II stability/assembly factor-like uncharacterized protein